MSILRVDEIRDNGATFNDVVTFANSGGTENGKLARAWVNFNGTGTVAIRAQFNVSSITDNGTGDYTVNFSNAMSDANYAGVVAAGHQDYHDVRTSYKNSNFAAGSLRFSIGNNVDYVDGQYANVSIFR